MSEIEHQIVKKEFTIKNKLGLHARAAAAFVKVSNHFQSDITVRKNSTTVNGKSIMGMLMLAAAKESIIEISAAGEDSSEVIETLGELIENKFGEE